MISQTPELEVIRQRLEKLERENRRLKRAGSLGLLVVAAGFLMAQGKYNRRIEAEEFILTDTHGSERAELAWKDQAPRFVLLDAHGKPQAATGTTLLATNVGTSVIPSSTLSNRTALREPKHTGSGARAVAKHARTERPRAVDLPGTPGLPLVASLDPSFEASTTEWNADAAAISISNTPRPAATPISSASLQPATSLPGPDGPRHAAGEFPAASVAPLAVAPSNSQAAPIGTHGHQVLAQLEKPLDAGAAWPPTSVVSVAPSAAPSAMEAYPGVLPPPIALKVMGYADKPGTGRELFIAEDSEVFVVHEGDLFADRFRVLKITATEVEIEDETRRERFKLTFHP